MKEIRGAFDNLPLNDKVKLFAWPMLIGVLFWLGDRQIDQYDAMQGKLDTIIINQAENRIELKYHDERIKRLEDKQAIKYSYEKPQLP